MSKELIALEILYNDAKLDRDRIEKGGIVTYAEEIEHNERIKPYYDTIKQALQELDDIKNSNPIEAMECLEKIDDFVDKDYAYCQLGYYYKDFNTIKQYILKAQQQEKALKIIFEKMVNILLLELAENVDEYNERIVRNGLLTEEEFNKLQEYFDNENNK